MAILAASAESHLARAFRWCGWSVTVWDLLTEFDGYARVRSSPQCTANTALANDWFLNSCSWQACRGCTLVILEPCMALEDLSAVSGRHGFFEFQAAAFAALVDVGGGAEPAEWMIIQKARHEVFHLLQKVDVRFMQGFKAVSWTCAWGAAERSRWEVRASRPVAAAVEAKCAHVHLPRCCDDPVSPPCGIPAFAVAAACAWSAWAAEEFLIARRRWCAPTPQAAGVRGSRRNLCGNFVAIACQAGLTPHGEGVGIPSRQEVGYEVEEGPLIFAGQGSAVARRPRTMWATPFTMGQHGDYESCRRRYAEWLAGNGDLLDKLGELSGCQIVCECPIGWPCHTDVIVVAAAAYLEAGVNGAVDMVRDAFKLGTQGIPARPRVSWPQESLAAAVRALLPRRVADLRVPFIEDIVNSPPFTLFEEWLESDYGEAELEQPPMWCGRGGRSMLRLTEGRQDGAFGSKMAAPPVVEFGLQKERHLARACEYVQTFGFPLDSMELIDSDLRFAAEWTVAHRGDLRAHRKSVVRAVKHLAERLAPLTSQLRAAQPPTVRAVAGTMDLGLLAVLCVLLRWPDVELIRCFMDGFRVVGDIEGSGVYPRNPATEFAIPDDIMAGSAEYVDELMVSLRRPKNNEFLVEECMKDQDRLFGDRLRTRGQMDSRWGRGNWRPIPRFLVVQGNGKKRACDDGARSNHNRSTVVHDKLVLCSAAQPGIAVKAVVAASRRLGANLAEEGHAMESGTDDLPDAYRHVPVHPDFLNVHVVAVVDEESADPLFQEMWGMVFGLAGAVPCFSRWPRVVTAVARRFLMLLVAMYFDDASVQDLKAAKGEAQASLAELVRVLGTPFAMPKRQHMDTQANFLGVTHDLSEAITKEQVAFWPKAELRDKVKGMFNEVIMNNSMTPACASKIRGTLGFLVRETWGKVGRGGMGPLIQREFTDTPPWSLSLSLLRSIEFHSAVLALSARRVMNVGDQRRELIVAASDGAVEDGLGASIAALFCKGQLRWGWCNRLTEEIVEAWQPSLNPIMKVEFMALFVGVLLSWDRLSGCDVVWFIDNTSALAAAIKGSSRDLDVDAMSQVLNVLLYVGDIRIYYEYVESESNWADGASRDLVHDSFASLHGFDLRLGQEFRPPSGPLLERLEAISALGSSSGLRECLSPVVEALRRAREEAVGVVAHRAAARRQLPPLSTL